MGGSESIIYDVNEPPAKFTGAITINAGLVPTHTKVKDRFFGKKTLDGLSTNN